jgi:uncharacterized protein YndB with AHSA1/START domain
VRTFGSETRIRAPRERVFEIMTDHARYAPWGPASRVTVDPEGVPAPNGVGAVRTFHAGPVRSREEVVAFEPPTRMVYRLRSGVPVRDYRSEMVLDQDGDTTVLRWSSTFEPVMPGTGRLLEWLLARAVDGFREGIRRACEEDV